MPRGKGGRIGCRGSVRLLRGALARRLAAPVPNRLMQFRFLLLFASILPLSVHARPTTNAPAASILGQPTFTSGIEFDPPTSRSFYGSNGLAIDPTTGKLFVSDERNHRILRFSSTAAYQNYAEAEAVFGQGDFTSNLPNRGAGASSSTLNLPAHLCFDSEGNLWVADSGNARVLRYDAASSKTQFGAAADAVIGQADFVTTTPATNSTSDSGFIEPVGVAVDSADNLYVLENGNVPRILRFANAKTASGDVVAASYLGAINGSNQFVPGVTATSFSSTPYGLFVDDLDRLWVADASNHRVLRFDTPTVIGSAANAVFGQLDFTSNALANPPTAASLFIPFHMCVDSEGTLWISDTGNFRILGFLDIDSKANGAAADIVLGQADFVTGSGQPYNARTTGNPRQIVIGREGSLFVGEDSNAARVKRWSDPVVVQTAKRVTARGKSARVRGTSSGAVSLTYKVAGQGGFRNLPGPIANWQVRVNRLKKKTTSVTVQAKAFDNRTATAVVRVTKRR